MGKVLEEGFYQRPGVVSIAKELLGKVIVTKIDGVYTSGKITETEAYSGQNDKACHANNGKLTPRTTTMYLAGGHAYVYLCYGLHHLFNIVTNEAGKADAVLIRAVQPLEGLPAMVSRRGMPATRPQLTAGPGAMSKALGITIKHNGLYLLNGEISIMDEGIKVDEAEIASSHRIGVAYAGEDAALPWRFFINDNKWVSNSSLAKMALNPLLDLSAHGGRGKGRPRSGR